MTNVTDLLDFLSALDWWTSWESDPFPGLVEVGRYVYICLIAATIGRMPLAVNVVALEMRNCVMIAK